MTAGDLPDPALARAVAVPLRRRVLGLVLAADHPVTVAELTEQLGCNHNAVRQHLAQLRAAGLVAESLEERDQPGRPRLLYVASQRPNPYARLARMLLAARRTGQTPRAAGRDAGLARARAAEFDAVDALDALDALEADAALQGFSPRRVGHGRHVEVVLDVCPFADVAVDDPTVVCALHRGLAEGLVAGIGGASVDGFVAKDPDHAGCRVKVRRTT